jgi:hypothetical protein
MRSYYMASLSLIAVLAAVTYALPIFAQEPMPNSGALVAISTGQTLWIAPVNGKMQVIALDDYVIPRKDGFWRVWLQSKSSPPDVRGVRLGKSKDVIAQSGKAPAENKESQTERQDQSEQGMPAESTDVHRPEVQFLSPNYISVYTVTEQSEAETFLKISDAQPGENSLVFTEEKLPIPVDVRAKDAKACVDPENQDPDYQEYASQEESFGIVRGRGNWRYSGQISLRGYSTECGVSVLPPKSIVAQIELFPAWKEIKDVYPDAEDAFPSPAHDMLLVFYQNRLMVAPVQQGKLGRPLLRLEVNGKPVMVEWALGKFVDAWTKQLTPYFGPYQPKMQTSE